MSLAWILLILLPSALHGGQEPDPGQLPPGVEVKIQARPLKATVGDPIEIDLDFTLPGSARLQFPNLPGQLGEFTILESHPGPAIPAAGQAQKTAVPPAALPAIPAPGQTRHQARIIAAVYKPGEFQFPALSFRMRDAAGNEVQISSPTISILIESVLSDKDLNLRDLKKQAEIEDSARWLRWLLLGAPALILLLAAIWWRIRSRRRPAIPATVQPEIDPLDLAEANLRDLVERGLLAQGHVKQFYVRLSEITKKVLEASCGIQTVEKTTAEILEALRTPADTGTPAAAPAHLERIETLLLSCDLVKFARYIPSQDENQRAVQEAFRVISECRIQRQPVAAGTAPVAGVS